MSSMANPVAANEVVMEEGENANSTEKEKEFGTAEPQLEDNITTEDSGDLYINVNTLTAEEKKSLGVPTFCEGSFSWWVLFLTWIVFSIGAPIILISGSTPFNAGVGVTLAVVGFLYGFANLAPVITKGGLCMPEASPNAVTLEDTEGTKKECKVKKLYLIYNPHGGRKMCQKMAQECVIPLWEKAGVEVTVLETEYAGHARDFAKTCDFTNYDGICIMGGDGSINEVVNGMFMRKDKKVIPLGVLPGGTGNSFMADFGTWNVKEAAERILEGEINYVDANKVTIQDKSMLSVNLIAIGVVGDVGIVAEDLRFLGVARYDVCAVFGVAKKTSVDMKVKMTFKDGSTNYESGKFLTGFVMNNQHFGKGLRPTPDARMDDGLLDLALVRLAERGDLLATFQQLPTAAHSKGNWKHFSVNKCVSCILDMGDKGVCNIDGEIVKHFGTIEVECLPKLIPLFAPSTYEAKTVAQMEKERFKGMDGMY